MRISAYWAGCDNFGDKLTKAVVEAMTGIEIYPDNIDYAKMCGAGSILNCFVTDRNECKSKYPLYVFGTGFDNHVAELKGNFIRELRPFAVRGIFTQRYMELVGKREYKDVVLGDIGLLARHLIKEKNIKPKYDLGIVPHYVDENDIRFQWIHQNCLNSKIISVHLEPREFIRQIVECRYVISTAMHPIIACDALRIPNIWAYLPNANQVDMSVKFNDYYSAFGLKKQALILDNKVLEQSIIDMIEAKYDIEDGMVNRKIRELEQAFLIMWECMQKDRVIDWEYKCRSKGAQLFNILKESKRQME